MKASIPLSVLHCRLNQRNQRLNTVFKNAKDGKEFIFSVILNAVNTAK